MRPQRPRLPLVLLAASVLAGAGAAHAQSAHDPTDPWEPMNRKFFALNEALDRTIIAPIAHSFGSTPGPFRKGLVNFSRNLSEPVVFVNDVLQGRVGAAAKTLVRFVMNSTVGIGGLVDVLRPFGRLEMVRTGVVAMVRSAEGTADRVPLSSRPPPPDDARAA